MIPYDSMCEYFVPTWVYDYGRRPPGKLTELFGDTVFGVEKAEGVEGVDGVDLVMGQRWVVHQGKIMKEETIMKSLAGLKQVRDVLLGRLDETDCYWEVRLHVYIVWGGCVCVGGCG